MRLCDGNCVLEAGCTVRPISIPLAWYLICWSSLVYTARQLSARTQQSTEFHTNSTSSLHSTIFCVYPRFSGRFSRSALNISWRPMRIQSVSGADIVEWVRTFTQSRRKALYLINLKKPRKSVSKYQIENRDDKLHRKHNKRICLFGVCEQLMLSKRVYGLLFGRCGWQPWTWLWRAKNVVWCWTYRWR